MSTLLVDSPTRTTYIDNDRGRVGTEGLGPILRQIRKARGLSQQALASRAGLSRNFLAKVERAEANPTLDTLRRISTGLGASIGELLGEELSTDAPPDMVPVPLVADAVAAGPPIIVADQVERYEHLPYTLLRSLGVNPRQTVLVRLGAGQDSMADTIPPGAMVLLDRTPMRDVAPRGIYAVREDVGGEMGSAVKRLVFDSEARVLILLSDNPAYLPRAIRLKAGQPISDVVIGRVVWWALPASNA
jgi:transcriptional regulator with XRE-family HTH domain